MAAFDRSNIQFCYRELELGKRQIRLMVLAGVRTNGVLDRALDSISLDKQPPYVALPCV